MKSRLIKIVYGIVAEGINAGSPALSVHLFHPSFNFTEPYMLPLDDNILEYKYSDFKTTLPLYATQQSFMFQSRPTDIDVVLEEIFKALPNGEFRLENGKTIALNITGADALGNDVFVKRLLQRIDRHCDIENLVAPKELYLRTFANVPVYPDNVEFLKKWEQRTTLDFKRHVHFENIILDYDKRVKIENPTFENIVSQVAYGFRSTFKFEIDSVEREFQNIQHYIEKAKERLIKSDTLTDQQKERGYYALSVAKVYVMYRDNFDVEQHEEKLLELCAAYGFTYEPKAFATGNRKIVG